MQDPPLKTGPDTAGITYQDLFTTWQTEAPRTAPPPLNFVKDTPQASHSLRPDGDYAPTETQDRRSLDGDGGYYTGPVTRSRSNARLPDMGNRRAPRACMITIYNKKDRLYNALIAYRPSRGLERSILLKGTAVMGGLLTIGHYTY